MVHLGISDLTVEPDLLSELKTKHQVRIDDAELPPNSYSVVRDQETSLLAMHTGNAVFTSLVQLSTRTAKSYGISPKDARQSALFDSLLRPEIQLCCAIGQAGTGKTTLAIAYALHEYLHKDKAVVLTKPAVTIGRGKAFGPVPGTIQEKYNPYLASYSIVFEKLLGSKGKSYLELASEKSKLQFMPIELARGCTFEDSIFILDEAQNLTWHELYSTLTRIGENSKCILLGDLSQIDTGLDKTSTGLWKLLHSKLFWDSNLTSAIELLTQYRSPLTELCVRINGE